MLLFTVSEKVKHQTIKHVRLLHVTHMPGIQDLFFDRLLNIVVQDIGNLLKVPYVFFSGYNQDWRLDLFELLNGGGVSPP
jgi:hypothetical protein